MSLARREKFVLTGGAVAAALILAYGLVVAPALATLHTLGSQVTRKRMEIRELETLRRQYLSQQAQLAEIGKRLEQRGKSFSLFSFVEEEAKKAGVRDKMAYVKPAPASPNLYFPETAVELKLEGVYLKQLTVFLEGIEKPEEMVTVRRLQVRARTVGGQRLVDGVFVLSTFGFPTPSEG